MNEKNYLKATNHAKVQMALTILNDVLPGDEYGISKDKYSAIMENLMDARDELAKSYQLEPEETLHPYEQERLDKIGLSSWQSIVKERDNPSPPNGLIRQYPGCKHGSKRLGDRCIDCEKEAGTYRSKVVP